MPSRRGGKTDYSRRPSGSSFTSTDEGPDFCSPDFAHESDVFPRAAQDTDYNPRSKQAELVTLGNWQGEPFTAEKAEVAKIRRWALPVFPQARPLTQLNLPNREPNLKTPFLGVSESVIRNLLGFLD